MVRPHLDDQDEARKRLLEAMVDQEYPCIESHEPIIQYAIVFTCRKGDEVAGFIWFYNMAEKEGTWTIHFLVLPEYRKRFFWRNMGNAIAGTIWSLGCNSVVAENSYKEWMYRLGGYDTEDGVQCDLPWKWR